MQEISLFTAVNRDSAKYVELTALHFIKRKQPRYVIYVTLIHAYLVKKILYKLGVKALQLICNMLKNFESYFNSNESINEDTVYPE